MVVFKERRYFGLNLIVSWKLEAMNIQIYSRKPRRTFLSNELKVKVKVIESSVSICMPCIPSYAD